MGILANAGFESGVATPWTLTAGAGGGEAVVESANPYRGAYNLRLKSGGSGQSSNAVQTVAIAFGGYRVRFKFRAKLVSGVSDIQMQVEDDIQLPLTTTATPTSSYVQYTSGTLVIDAAATLFRVRLVVAGVSSTNIRFDDVTVEILDAGGNLLFDGDGDGGGGGGTDVASHGVEVDWDNDGVWGESGDAISADVLHTGEHATEWERGTEDPDTDRAPVGTAQLVVKNDTGKYSPENTASPLYPNVLPRRRIRIRAILDGVMYNLWKGYIVKFVPHPDHTRKTCTIFCEDGMGWLSNPDATINAPQGAPLNNVRLGADPGPLKAILDAAGWPAADRSLAGGVDRIGPWYVTGQTPRVAVQDLMQMERSLAYITGAGLFKYEDRHTRLKGAGLVSQATFSDTMVDVDYEFSDRSIINEVEVTGVERTAGASEYVWGLAEKGWISPLATVELWATLAKPVSGITTPAANVDYKGNQLEDGTGTDFTASISVVATQFGQKVRLRVTNNHATQSIWVIPGTSNSVETLRIQGTPYTEREVFQTVKDAASQTAYQRRVRRIDTKFLSSSVRLSSHARFIVSERKDPKALYPRMHLTNGSSALLVQILTRDVGDRITVTLTDLGISARNYHINKVEHRVSDGGTVHEATWWLEAVRLTAGVEETYWRIGTSKIGAGTGARTKIGF